MRRELTGGVASGSGGDACPRDSVCALYVFSGVSNDTTMEKGNLLFQCSRKGLVDFITPMNIIFQLLVTLQNVRQRRNA